jgi:hypothetical protein
VPGVRQVCLAVDMAPSAVEGEEYGAGGDDEDWTLELRRHLLEWPIGAPPPSRPFALLTGAPALPPDSTRRPTLIRYS